MDEVAQKENGFSSGRGEFKVPGGHQVEISIGSGGALSVNSVWLPVNLNSQISFPPGPEGFWGLMLSIDWPSKALLVTLTHRSPLTAAQIIPRGEDGS